MFHYQCMGLTTLPTEPPGSLCWSYTLTSLILVSLRFAATLVASADQVWQKVKGTGGCAVQLDVKVKIRT